MSPSHSAQASSSDRGRQNGVSRAHLTFHLLHHSFVIKKKGLLAATRKSGNAAGEGHAYLRNWLWWVGMIMMIVGEICNFVAFGEYRFLHPEHA